MNFHEIKVFIAMHTKQLREWHCFVTLKNTNFENRRNKRGMWHLHNNPWRLRSSNVRLFTTFPRESSYSSYEQNRSKVIKTLQSLGYHRSPSLLLFEMSRAKRSITSQRKGGKQTKSSLDHLQIIKSYFIDTSLRHKIKHSPQIICSNGNHED